MTCGELRKILNDYCAGELDSHEMKTVEQHIFECKDCDKALAQTRKVFEELRQMGEVKAPKGFAEDVRRRIKNSSQKKSGLRKIFYPLSAKIPLELAASLLIGVFIYRVIVPHHPIGKGTYLEVEQNPVVQTREDAVSRDRDIEQSESGSGILDEKKIPGLLKEEKPERKQSDVQENLKSPEKESEKANLEEGRLSTHSSVSTAENNPGLFLPEPKAPSSFKDQAPASPPVQFQLSSMDEKPSGKTEDLAAEEKQKEETDLAQIQSAGFSTGKGNSQMEETSSGGLGLGSARQESFKEETPGKFDKNARIASEEISESFAARPSAIAQPLARVSEKAKVERKKQYQENFIHYLWRYDSEESLRQMYILVNSSGWKMKSKAAGTLEISLPRTGEEDFLNWLRGHGKLMSMEDGAKPENSNIVQSLILDLNFEEAS